MEIDPKVLQVHGRLLASGLDPDYAAMKLSQMDDGTWSADPDAVAETVLAEAPEKFIDRRSSEPFLERVWDRIEAEKRARRGGSGSGEESGGEGETVYDRIRREARQERESRSPAKKLDDRLSQT